MCFVFSLAYLVLLLEFLLIYLGNEWKFILWSILDCSLIFSFWGVNSPISCIFWCSFMVFWVVSFSLLCVVIDIYFFIVDSFLVERVCGVCVCVCVCVCMCMYLWEWKRERRNLAFWVVSWVVNVALQIFLHVICQYPKFLAYSSHTM